jgi:hypothetical protein
VFTGKLLWGCNFGCQRGYLRFILSQEYAEFRATINKMPQISTVKNAVQGVVKKDRLLGALFSGTKSVLVAFGRTFYAFWLQATGLLYLFFTLSGAGSLFLLYHKHELANHQRLTILSIFTVVCFCFTVQSFMKAKRTMQRR